VVVVVVPGSARSVAPRCAVQRLVPYGYHRARVRRKSPTTITTTPVAAYSLIHELMQPRESSLPRLHQLSQFLGYGKPLFEAIGESEQLGYRVGISLISGEKFISGWHPTWREAKEDAATKALRADCFRILTIPKHEWAQWPSVKFQGKIDVVTTHEEAQLVIAQFRGRLQHPVFGLDTESQPTRFKRGSSQGSYDPCLPELIQIASDDHAILFKMRDLENQLPRDLGALLSDPRMMKLGSGIKGDCTLLKRFDPQLNIVGHVDFATLAPMLRVLPFGLQSLTATFLRRKLDKREQISDWGSRTLTREQVGYLFCN